MSPEEACKPRVRPLHDWERQEASLVFGNNLRYSVIRIHECTPLPDRINQMGAFMKGMKIKPDSHNAITLGNHIYFPIRLLDQPVPLDHPEHYKIPWLIHELTHAWQFQQLGWGYLAKALSAQMRLKGKAYDFGGEDGLLKRWQNGQRLSDFNLEQQGDIARSYYEQLIKNRKTIAWEPFVKDFKKIA